MGKRRFLQSYIRLLLLAGMLTATMACSDSETYTRYPCHLVIDNSIHQNSTLGAAMNAMSPGVFCIISSDELKKQYAFTNNLGQESRVNFTAVDLRTTRQLGMNNAVIVGFGTLTSEFMAYDRECPMCYNPDAIPLKSRPLKIDGAGIAKCETCGRLFDMNNYGICTSEGGVKGMNRYHCSTTGPFGMRTVTNR